jgi:hypothetical protein
MRIYLAAALAVLAFAGGAEAQLGVTVGVGAGGFLESERQPPTTLEELNHRVIFASLRVPVLPVELRGELMWPEQRTDQKERAYVVSAVYSIPLLFLTPYAQAGWGDYNYGDPSRSRLSMGIGARLHVGPTGFFAEATRYHRLGRDIVTAGVILQWK